MAKKTGSGGGSKKKAAKKPSGKRNAIVTGARAALREACPHTMLQTRPLPTDASGKLATRVTDFTGAYETYLDGYRKHIADGGKAADAPAMPTGKWFDPNIGMLSANQFAVLGDQTLEEGASVVFPPKYNPVQADAAHALNCLVMRRGTVKNHKTEPKDWNEKLFGPWMDEYEAEDGEPIFEPSGMFVDHDLPRQAHASKAEEMITDENSLQVFGNLRVVCGDGTHDGAACFSIRAFKGGNYGALDLARKRLSLAGKPVTNVVFKIEDRPNNGGAYVIKGRWTNGARVIMEIPFMPGQVMTPGHLSGSNGKALDAKAIRKLDGDTKGLKFKALEAPIVGKNVPFESIWTQVSQDKVGVKRLKERTGRSDEWESGSPREKSIVNIRTIARTSPFARFAFGFRNVQAAMVPFTVASGDGKIEDGDFGMGVALGARSADEYNVGVLEVKPKAVKKAAKPKATEKTTAAKSGKKTTAKKTTAAKKPSDAAPTVEHDTADEPEKAETVAAE